MTMIASLVLAMALADPPAGTAWNRYETAAFDVLATHPTHGQQATDQVERMRGWVLGRWAIKTPPSVGRCKIMIANDQAEFSTLFPGKTAPTFRVEREQGKIKNSAIWLTAAPRWQTGPLSQMMTEVVWSEFEEHHRTTVPLWARRGVVTLNGHLPGIKATLTQMNESFSRDLPCFWGKELLTITADKMTRYTAEQQQMFDAQSACLCLYLMKERPGKFLDFLDAGIREPATGWKVLGLTDDSQFDRLILPYMKALCRDVVAGDTPNSYLTWK